jgi:hypothetical protein
MSTAVCIVGSVLLAAAAAAQPGGEVTVLAVSGDPVPGSTENFHGFLSPVINNNDDVVFWYRTGSGSEEGYSLYSNGSLSVPIRSGDTLGNGDSFQDFRSLNSGGGAGQHFASLTDSGTIVCKSSVLEMSTGTSYVALLRVNGGSPEVVAREGQTLPDGSGDLDGSFENARVNQAGEVAFIAFLANVVPPRTQPAAILVQADGTLTPVILSWSNGSANRVVGPRDLALSDSGKVATSIFEVTAGVSETKAVLWDSGSLTTLAYAGVPTPGIGTIGGIGGSEGQFIIDEQGTASFFVTLPFEPFDMNSAILSADSMSMSTLVREGVDVPSNADQNDLQSLGNSITNNRSGSVAFATRSSVYLSRPSGLQLIAQDGDSVLGGAGQLALGINHLALNNNDHLAFLSDIRSKGGGIIGESIFFFSDSLGFVELLTRGDPLLGSTISDLGFVSENVSGEESNGLSDTGLVAFSFSLTDGRTGIAVIDPFTQPCLADVNGDGSVTPTDFTAWINAFNNSLPECDQNGDGSCTATDFTAWIANFNAGCP